MVVPKPSDDELQAKVKELVWTVDLETMGLKAFIKLLSSKLDNVDLKPRKAFIKEAVKQALNEGQQNNNEASSSSADEESDDEEKDEDVKILVKKKGGTGGTEGGLKATKKLSEKLANFIGKGDSMARTEVVKSLWDYIKEHNLQNPNNKREILLDSAMQNVFGCPVFTMFTLNKYISAHMEPFKPVDLTTNSTKTTKTTTTTPSKRKKSLDRPNHAVVSTGGSNSSTSAKRRKTGSQPPYRLSQELAAVVGTDILPRPQVVKKLWVYIKANQLQDEQDKRNIICDDRLRDVFQKPRISMFHMNAELSRHLYERVDRSEYHAESNCSSDNDA